MREESRHDGRTPSRRSILLAAPALLVSFRASRAQGGDPSWPPVFETGRSQFTIVRPRTPMPPLRLQDLHGKDVMLTAKPGRVTVINFWATWCAACRLDLPVIASLARSQPEGLDVLAICTDIKDVRKIRAYLGGVTAPNLSCYIDAYGIAADPNRSPEAVFKLTGMPITYLIGTSSRIEGYITGAADWLSPSGARLLQFYREQAG
ncbi:TlpA family protein disulfide reductase [Bradyrhizobium manausense]|uniref:TlpA family protein disulfide reductase n=1 Tax=Bradyrhizobium TaxID=374 RepID=UPI001BA7DB49|nr:MULTISPECIES: TlpA disulfide reductase family protein [Bradyrhizobium]MBR0826604.1 TlpA family protein disulfide reductase [Bradyrhizobium manausense]UVO28993.1 TlpA family protein disulfide reductase [Bradyrhizobium arachidis]